MIYYLLLLLLLLIWQSPGLPGWRKVNLTTVTRRPLHPSIAAGFYCLTTSPGFLPALCEKWSGFFYVHRVWLSYTRDRRLKVSSERLGNEDKSALPKGATAGPGFEPGTSGMEVTGLNRSATIAPLTEFYECNFINKSFKWQICLFWDLVFHDFRHGELIFVSGDELK